MNIDRNKLVTLWHKFYEEKGHAIIGSASVIPENDPTVLFTTAGMHPLVPYLLGQKHPAGDRLCNVQKCIRTGDIDEVGDDSHCTFFEMLGNWSLGDYFKEEQIKWSYEFLTSKEYLGIDPKNLAVTVFAGDDDCPRDDESAKIWLECGIKKDMIFYLGKKHNWWGPAGITGPCGPDTEMFIVKDVPDCSKDCSPACDCGKYLEIWNDVFMQYNKTNDGTFEPLKQRNVDTGMGLERTLCVLQGKTSVYDIDIFQPIIRAIENSSGKKYLENKREIRIVADHIRTAVHMIGDRRGITCSNLDQGYVLRRLLRRAIRYSRTLGMAEDGLKNTALAVIEVYAETYQELKQNKKQIIDEITLEKQRFERTLNAGIKEFEKLASSLDGGLISGKEAFRLYDTFGFPIEMTNELAAEKGLKVDTMGFEASFSEHKQRSNSGLKAKGGMADGTEKTVYLHTATHLLHRALKIVLDDPNANQKGSNINEERLRFDFSYPEALTPVQIKEIEKLVNSVIIADLEVLCEEMTVAEAKESGSIGLFEDRYGGKVKVYSIGDFSKEICGGPHALTTGVLGRFKIIKEQSAGAGIRRIKAILE